MATLSKLHINTKLTIEKISIVVKTLLMIIMKDSYYGVLWMKYLKYHTENAAPYFVLTI